MLGNFSFLFLPVGFTAKLSLLSFAKEILITHYRSLKATKLYFQKKKKKKKIFTILQVLREDFGVINR